MNLASSKQSLRQEYKRKIESLSFMDLVQKSHSLSQFFHQYVGNSRVSLLQKYIVSFYPFETEPQVNIESEQRNEPYQVAYVRIANWVQRLMIPAEARRDQPGQWEEFEVSPHQKIYQPTSHQKICSPESVAMILVPALAFTARGERLGRGAGFYDRFVKSYPQALRVGIAFEEQIAPSLPTESWDEKVDVILTDRQIYETAPTKWLGEWKLQGKILERT